MVMYLPQSPAHACHSGQLLLLDQCICIASHCLAQALLRRKANVLPLQIGLYSTSFGWGWGPIGWLIPSEIHDLNTRSAGQSITVFTQLMSGAVVTISFLPMMCSMQYGVVSAGGCPALIPAVDMVCGSLLASTPAFCFPPGHSPGHWLSPSRPHCSAAQQLHPVPRLQPGCRGNLLVCCSLCHALRSAWLGLSWSSTCRPLSASWCHGASGLPAALLCTCAPLGADAAIWECQAGCGHG